MGVTVLKDLLELDIIDPSDPLHVEVIPSRHHERGLELRGHLSHSVCNLTLQVSIHSPETEGGGATWQGIDRKKRS